MKTFLFIVLIPLIAGFMTGMAGIYVMEDPLAYFIINAPICAACVVANIVVE